MARHADSWHANGELPHLRRMLQILAGFTLLNVRCSGPNHDLGPLRDWIGWRDSLGPYDPGTEDL